MPFLPSKSMTLLALLLPFIRNDLQRKLATIPPNCYLHFLARGHFSKRVGIIVNILDRGLSYPGNYIPGAQPCPLGRGRRPYPVQFHAVALIRVIGNRAEIHSKPSTGRPRFHFDLGESNPLWRSGDRLGNPAHQRCYSRRSLSVYLLCSVSGFMVVIVTAREEKQHRNISDIERLVIARPKSILSKAELKLLRAPTTLRVDAFEHRFPRRRGAHPANKQRVVSQPADHIHV